MKYAALILLALLVGGCGGCASLPPGKPAYHAAVRLSWLDGGLCSATAVGSHTLLSAAHCFDGATAGLVRVNGTLTTFTVVADDGKDHVLLHVYDRQGYIAKIGRPAKRGQMLSLIGNPLGFYSLLRMGRVAGWDDDKVDCPDGKTKCRVMLSDLETAGGDSGGGYFNARGEVVGVHSGTASYLAWALAYSYPLEFTAEQLALIQ